MCTYRAIFSALFLSVSLFGAPSACKTNYYEGEAPDILNAQLASKTKELCFSEFAILHSALSKTALWSAEHLTREQLRSKSKRTDEFYPEERLGYLERSELDDYAGSGYDRGHLAPSADMPTPQAQHESFSLANMIPQHPENNRGIWSAIEGATRHLANQKSQIYVITGPLFAGENLKRLKGRVLIPSHIYKAIYDPISEQGSAYLVANAPGDDYKVISISELERISGIRHFPKMSDSAKQNPMALPAPLMRKKQQHVSPPAPTAAMSGDFRCSGKRTCKEMSSCAEARFYLAQCGASSLDGDGDGTPCAKLCR
jgi:endonuclease G, mitochondrial